ncbi:hypothetical protein GCM10018966_000010 [Streptomyces yanii]
MPTYAASKAAVHAYSEALRAQLNGTGVEVAETRPPGRGHHSGGRLSTTRTRSDSPEFATEVMAHARDRAHSTRDPRQRRPDARWAERDGTYDELVTQRSQALAMLPSRQGQR